jgi:hypothetical protein
MKPPSAPDTIHPSAATPPAPGEATRPAPDGAKAPGGARSSTGLLIVRYGIGGVMVLAGIIMLIISPSGLGVEGFGMAAGGGLAVLLLNLLYRMGVSGDREREQEEEARRYFDVHGEWPDEDDGPRGRTWRLAPGVRTLEDELAERDLARGELAERGRRAGQ